MEEKFLDNLRAFLHQASSVELLTASGLVREQLELRCMDTSNHASAVPASSLPAPTPTINYAAPMPTSLRSADQDIDWSALEDDDVEETFGFLLDQELGFGKYRGDSIKAVMGKEPEYLIWAAQNVGFFKTDYLDNEVEAFIALIENHLALNPKLVRSKRR